MELRDQDFQVGDEVVRIASSLVVSYEKVLSLNGSRGRFKNAHDASYPIGLKVVNATRTGQTYVDSPQCVFHRDAVTFDEYGRLTAIDYDYVKPRAPKIVTKEPHEFTPFEKVLTRDSDHIKWRCDFFSHYNSGDKSYPYVCSGHGWAQCIPYEGNEHLVGKVTE